VGDFVTQGVNGILGADDEALADALARLVVDSSLRRRIAHENATVAPSQTWSSVVAQAEEEYRRAGAR
jgi:glycosyltransferase involved in cell wall biosynthesis